jgi:hypothetical protein
MTQYSTDIREYATQKFIEYGLLDEEGNHINKSWFDPWIYPSDNLTTCSVCKEAFEHTRQYFDIEPMPREIEMVMKHHNYCMWYDYYVNRMKLLGKKFNCKVVVTYGTQHNRRR